MNETKATKRIDIVLIDDHKLFREGVKRILDFDKSFKVVAEGDDGEVAHNLVEKHNHVVVLMDINMTKTKGIEATKELNEKNPDNKVINLSIHDEEYYITHALQTGAMSYLLKEMDSDSVVNAIKIVNDGGSYFHPTVTHNL